jgi:hypothetical protein
MLAFFLNDNGSYGRLNLTFVTNSIAVAGRFYQAIEEKG